MRRTPNHDALGNDLTGQPVLWDASTGDCITVNNIRYVVRDTYPFGARLERATPYGPDFIGRSYEGLKRDGAVYAN